MKSRSPGPQQHRLPMGFQQASPAALFDLSLPSSASVIITLVSSDMPLCAVVWVGVLSMWAPVGAAPFPVQGLIPGSFVTGSAGSALQPLSVKA